MASPSPLRCHVLSIQDNEVDRGLLREVWGVDPEIKLTTIGDGHHWLEHLTTVGERIPNLIVLASRFPITQLVSVDVLRSLKADPQLRAIPIIVFSGERDPQIFTEFYENHAACVIEIPSDFAEYVTMLEGVKSYWLGVARLPSETLISYE